MIYIANADWRPDANNPFSEDGSYGPGWSAFLYDPQISYFTNVYEGARLYTVRFAPDADREHWRFYDFLSYEKAYHRNVIVLPGPGMDMGMILEQYDTLPQGVTFRNTDQDYMVHSTTMENYQGIQASGALFSPNRLKSPRESSR